MPLKDHPLRSRVVSELHMRRMPALGAHTQMVQIVRLVHPQDRPAERDHVLAMPGVPPDGITVGDRHASGRTPSGSEFLWEGHSEASTMTAIFHRAEADPLAPGEDEPDAMRWLADAPGEVIRAVRIVVAETEAEALKVAETMSFSEPDLVSFRVGAARVWSDYRVHDDGFGRLLVASGGTAPSDLGRLVQRLQELGNYRNLALLGLPVAQAQGPALADLEMELGRISQRLAQGEAGAALLDELCALSARTAAIADDTAFRMSATAAYGQIAHDRLKGMECTPIPGFQKLDDFVERRLLPAVRTCASFSERLESLSARIERATALLRTRVEMTLQAQNTELLRSMERTGSRQLRLQHLVEGLSVAAVGYYALGLASHVFEGLGHVMRFSPEPLEALAVAPVLFLVWLYLRFQVRRIQKDDER